MLEVETVENLILGGGGPGKYIAWELAGQGCPTAVGERGLIGESCPNIACLPNKNVIHSAKAADLLCHASTYGLRTGPVATGMQGVHKRKMIAGVVETHKEFSANGLDFILGEGCLVAPRTIDVSSAARETRRIEAERAFLDLRTHASVPEIPVSDVGHPTLVGIPQCRRGATSRRV